MDIDKKALGQRIKDIRVKRKENMQQFADMIKNETDNASTPGKSNVSRWERGENIPNDITLEAIAKLGGKTVDELLYGDKNEIIKRHIIEMGINNEHDLLDVFIVYLNKNNKAYSDFYTNKSYTYGDYKPAKSAEHEDMKRKVARELFGTFIENTGVETIKYKTQHSYFFNEDTNSLKREIAFMMHKYFDLIIFEDDETFEGTVMNTVNALKYDFPFVEIEQSNLEDYIKFQTDQNETINEAHSENFFKTLIELFFYKEAYNIVSPFRQELVNLLNDYDKAMDKYLNKDNK